MLQRSGYRYDTDIWSLGILLHYMLFGEKPFEHEDKQELEKLILKGDWEFPLDYNVSDDAYDIIKKMLVMDKTKRITLPEILEHPFVKNTYIPEEYVKELLLPQSLWKRLMIKQPVSEADKLRKSIRSQLSKRLNESGNEMLEVVSANS